jgi:hypothetical protein
MAKIIGIENMTVDQLNMELQRGGKFVTFQYCISVLVMTFKRSSDIYFVKAGDSTFNQSYGFSFLTFFLGWWGFPWGPIWSVSTLCTNCSGGKNVTSDVIASLNRNSSASA